MTDRQDTAFDDEHNVGNGINSEQLGALIERVDQLETTVNHITEQHAELTQRLKEHADAIEDMNEDVDEMKESISGLTQGQKLGTSRINGLTSSVEALEEQMQDVHGDIDETSNKLNRRLTAVENTLDLDERDIAKAVKPNACELEQLAVLPDGSDSMNVRTERAIAVYEQFHDIATTVQSGGKRLLSKDIKMFLSGRADTDIAYSQVQRAIDTFDEKTGERFEAMQTEDGRALIWFPGE